MEDRSHSRLLSVSVDVCHAGLDLIIFIPCIQIISWQDMLPRAKNASNRSDGTLVSDKVRDLISVFRPNRSGNLTLTDFSKSVDSVYKELRLLRASVRNSQKIDRLFERISNVVFCAIVLCVSLALFGFDPLAIFLSLSSFALAFSFMISRASSNYFEVRLPRAAYLFVLMHNTSHSIDSTGSPIYSLPSTIRYRRSDYSSIRRKRDLMARND